MRKYNVIISMAGSDEGDYFQMVLEGESPAKVIESIIEVEWFFYSTTLKTDGVEHEKTAAIRTSHISDIHVMEVGAK